MIMVVKGKHIYNPMNKHLDILNDLYYWFYIKYNIEDINTEKLRRVSDKTITYYLENNIILGMWQWECDITKQRYESQHNNPEHTDEENNDNG